ncbi:HEAT SHOCK PROTEIN 26 [Salix koriyanagi]|uniref:HEAT SHOCK PROTEIN 26 n=1 Tax=Salix koriyanagi TaxID=2511006 RepID=A0A9Q0TSR6_9ROSI|nr:HEAT SHOCK PROTEIN 26 [Salix koriyanagi]
MADQLNDQAYEDYNPTLEWVRDAGFDTLLVYIPGFKKQELKVQVTSTRTLRIMGERSHGDNKRSRFKREIPIPLYYDADQITAKFEGGILQVKHPKKITDPANPTETGELTGGKINGVENATVTEANNIQVPPKTSEDQKSGLGLAEPEKNTSTGDQKHENEDYSVQNATKMQQEEETAAVSGVSKVKLAHHKQGFGGLVAEMKEPRKSTLFVVVAGLLVLLLAIYVQNAIRSNGEAEN